MVSFPPPLNPEQLYEENWTAEPTVNDCPIPTLPVRSEKPLTLSPPKAKVKLLAVNDPPMPVLPARLEIPVTFKVVRAEAEVTDNDPPMPTLPDEVRVEA